MDDARNAPIVSPADAEEFFATGSNALTCEPCAPLNRAAVPAGRPITVDVPAVGATPATELPSLVRDADGEDSGLPEPLRALVDAMGCEDLIVRITPGDVREMRAEDRAERERNRLLAELLFASRDLAANNILGGAVCRRFCRECQMDESALGVIAHAASCATGRVLTALERLAHSPAKDGGETAPETPEADDAIRPRGLNGRVCLKCGKRDGNWFAAERPESEVDLALLGLNQCVGAGADGKGHTLYTHQCADAKGGAR